MIRILIADDQNIIRQGIQAVLESKSQLTIVGTAENGIDAVEQVQILKPDIALIDIEMPGMSGIIAAQKIHQQFPATKVLVLSSHESREYVLQALQAGVEGYLLKSTLADDLERAIWSVYRGHTQIESTLLRKMLVEASFAPAIASAKQNGSTSVEKKTVGEKGSESNTSADAIKLWNINNKRPDKSQKIVNEDKITSPSKIDNITPSISIGQSEFEGKKKLYKDKDNSQSANSLQKKQKVKWLWISMILALVSGSILGLSWLRQKYFEKAEKPLNSAIPVRLKKLEASTIENSSEFVGSLEAQQRVRLKPETEGRIVEILVNEGERVDLLTPLVRLRPNKGQARLDSAIARTTSLKAAVEQANSELSTAKAEESGVLGELQLQEEEFKRTDFLVKEGAQSSQTLDRVERDRTTAIANLEAIRKRITAAEARITQTKADLQQAEAEADLEQENLEDTEITAPVAGTIGNIPVKVGDYVETPDVLTTITQNQNLELRFVVPTEQAAKLRLGLPVELRTAQEGEPLAVGEVSFISPRVNAKSQVVLTKARFSNPQTKLRDEQFVRARIIWRQDSGVLVASSAITRLGDRAFVYVVQNAETNKSKTALVAEQRPVELGSIKGNNYQVVEGLEPGETLITSGLLNISDGAPVVPESVSSSKAISP